MEITPKNWYELTPVGIRIIQPPSYEEWYAETAFWLTVSEISPIIIGDLLAYGEQMWPEDFAQVLDGFQARYAPQTLANYASVMRRVEPEVRHPQLSFGHYEALASLPPAEQLRVRDAIVQQNLTREETRRLVRQVKGKPASSGFRAICSMVTKELHNGEYCYVLHDPRDEEGEIPSGDVAVVIRPLY